MGSKEEVIRSNERTISLKVSTYLSVMISRVFPVSEYFYMAKVLIKRILILLMSPRDCNSINKLGLSDYRNTNILDSQSAESAKHGLIGTFHDVRRDICIKHVPDHQNSRS